jgi:hypothetical protein
VVRETTFRMLNEAATKASGAGSPMELKVAIPAGRGKTIVKIGIREMRR